MCMRIQKRVYIKSMERLLEIVISSGAVTKMKLPLFVFTALVAFATVNSHHLPDFGKGPLHEDIQYFLDMIPMDKIIQIVLEYASQDADFQAYLKYLESDEVKQMFQDVENIPEFHHFVTYLQNSGIYVYDLLNQINSKMGLPPYKPMLLVRKQKITGGVKGLFEDIKAQVSYDSIIKGYVYKMRHSQAFRDFVAHLKSPGHQQFINALYANKQFLKVRHTIVEKGIDVILIEDVIYTVLGVQFPEFNDHVFETYHLYENQLSKDIHDFIALLDMNKIMQLVFDYLQDDQVRKAMEYFQSEEFHVLVRKVEAMKEYQGLVLYLYDAGLDVFNLIQKIHKFFGMEDYVPPSHGKYSVYANLGGIKGLVDKIIATLPEEKIKALYEDKMKNSPAFKKFIEKLRSPDFKKIVDLIYSTPIFLEMRRKAIEAGLELEPLRELIKKVLGLDLHVPMY